MRRGGKRQGGMDPLSSLVGKVYPSQQPEEVRALRLFGVFAKSVPARVQNNAAPVSFRNGVLTVHTTTASWANALSLESSQIMSRLRLRLPDVRVQRMVFRVGRMPPLPEQIKVEKLPPPFIPLSSLPESVARELAHIVNDPLREAVARAAAVWLSDTRAPKRD
jgi:hypothetical protein